MVDRLVYSIWYFCLRLYCLVWVGSFVYGIVRFVGFLVLFLLCLFGCGYQSYYVGGGCKGCVLLVVLLVVCCDYGDLLVRRM